MSAIADNIRYFDEKLRDTPCRLVAVSKTHAPEKIMEAYNAGHRLFGENKVQELIEKREHLPHDIAWHLIGHLQTNKAGAAVRLFELIHSVDSLRLALAIDREAGRMKKLQHILIQVNIGEEESKSGVRAEEAERLAREAARCENLSIRGLMAIPPFFDDPQRARPYFSAVAGLRYRIHGAAIPNVSMETLSMGMTGDFEVAIEAGATLVRIGTAIFGKR
jgi:PLP dependent protein